MAREIEQATVAALAATCGPTRPTPGWLVRPGKQECGSRWQLVSDLYKSLTGLDLPDEMRSVERRLVDGVFSWRGFDFVLEVDEPQHFNVYRAATLRLYPDDLKLAYDKWEWIRRCDRKSRLEGGGFAAPKPPLFPGNGGRHRQRAFRDALADIVPLEHGFAPTLRLGDFELPWVEREGAPDRMEVLLAARFEV